LILWDQVRAGLSMPDDADEARGAALEDAHDATFEALTALAATPEDRREHPVAVHGGPHRGAADVEILTGTLRRRRG
jgi:hypothetical protein